VPIELIEEISFLDKEAKIDLTKETIKNAPEYNPALPVNEEYENVMRDFYGRKIIH
jgi:stress response protein YsnF